MDLASVGVGGEIVSCNDEFFAPASNLLKNTEPEWREYEYTDRGKWMDGWETRRRREPGHDWCVISLGIPGKVQRVTVDTSYFTGNYPESFSLEGASIPEHQDLDDAKFDDVEWVELLETTNLAGDAVETYGVSSPFRVTHLRLNIYPDGGIARLKVEGEPIPDLGGVGEDMDLANALVGGDGIEASDSHYNPPSKLVRPTEPAGMWDGWETRRRRGPGHDWAIVSLGIPGLVRSVDVDTRHFKGNPPGTISLHISEDGVAWDEVVTHHRVTGHEVTRINLEQPAHASLVKLDIFPDGGVARLRVWGIPDPEPAATIRVTLIDSLMSGAASDFFSIPCGSSSWVDEMVAGRPFRDAQTLLDAAEMAFDGLATDDWLEAFAAHPRIGDEQGAQPDEGEAMSKHEQSGVDQDSRSLLAGLNREYERQFGFTYIVRAAGRTGDELVGLLRSRLTNDRSTEITIAAEQQREITRLRLHSILGIPNNENGSVK